MLRVALRTALVTLLVIAPAASLRAQPASRVKDVDPGWNSTWPRSLTASDGRVYFVTDDGPHGQELWTTDGTQAGTVRVPGTTGIGSVFAASAGAFFDRQVGSGRELWRSDGTASGTALVKSGFDYVMESVAIGPITFFAVGNGQPAVLYRSDGNSAGTFQLFANDGQAPNYVRQLVASNGLLYFVASGTTPVSTLWRSDGTAAGTWPLPGGSMSSGQVGTLAAFAGGVAFAADDGVRGAELWRSDGTPQGTSLVADLVPGSTGSRPAGLTRAGNVLFFIAAGSTIGRELWATDGSTGGTRLVSDASPGPYSTPFGEMRSVGERLFFTNDDDGGLWTSDGTPAGTVVLRTGLDAATLSGVGSQLLFVVGANPFASDLWASDGTPAGTRRVRTICPARTCSPPRSMTPLGGALIFVAADEVYGPQLWRSDGTTAGTLRFAIIHPGEASSSPHDFHEVNGTAYFLASTSSAGGDTSLWASDGTGAGTAAVIGGVPISASLKATNTALFWVGRLEYPQSVLMMSDGTAAGTRPVPVPPELTQVERLVCTSDRAFFYERMSMGLWVADGSSSGSQLLGTFSGGYEGDFWWMTPLADDLLFVVNTWVGGQELWRSDGTVPGTSRVKVLSARSSPDCDGLLRRLGRSIIFLADDGSSGCNVWRSDGTPEGTVPVGVVGDGVATWMGPVASARGFLVFGDYSELWRTDGTPEGTFLLRSFPGEALVTHPGAGTREGVYFAAQTHGYPITTAQLWFTDGTVAGTELLHDFKAAPEDLEITSLGTANGRLVASVVTAPRPPEERRSSLWTSDGTVVGTVRVQDDASADPGGLPFGSVTLFAGTDPWAGKELWAMDGRAFAAPVSPTSLFVLSPCRVFDTRLAKGFLGGPALASGAQRVFPVGGVCGVPATARAIAANVTVTGATAEGLLRVHASDVGAPEAALLSFRAGQTRANNATVGLGPDAEITVRFEGPSGEVHVVLDVVGWYE